MAACGRMEACLPRMGNWFRMANSREHQRWQVEEERPGYCCEGCTCQAAFHVSRPRNRAKNGNPQGEVETACRSSRRSVIISVRKLELEAGHLTVT